MTITRAYRDGQLKAEGFPVAEVSDHLESTDTVVWVDLCGPSVDELHAMAGELGLHELAIEDALEPHQRPKVDRYASHLFVSCHAVTLDLVSGALSSTEIDAFVSPRWLITVRKDDGFDIDLVCERLDRSADLATNGAGYLLYGLLDVVVDQYFDTLDTLDTYYDHVAEQIFSDQPLASSEQRHWFEMRQSLVQFRRLVMPMREVVSRLLRREHGVVEGDLYPYMQDVYDHVLRVEESTDALRDLVSTIVETNLAVRDHRLNQSVKKVSGWAAILAVPTLVTGFYGMNVPYPGFGDHAGWITSAVLLVVCSLALYTVFKLKDWL